MKNCKWISGITLLVFMLFTTSAKSQEFSGIETMGNAVYEAFKANKVEQLDIYLPTAKDVMFAEKIYRYYRTDTMSSSELTSFIEEAGEDTRNSFKRIWNETNENNIRMAKTTLKRVDFTIRKVGEKVEADVMIVFEFISELYEIKLRKCFKTERGWIVGKSFSWGEGYDPTKSVTVCDCVNAKRPKIDALKEPCEQLFKQFENERGKLREEIEKCSDY
jgi:hypothetical protein